MNTDQNDIDRLMALWLADGLTEGEKQQFESWMKSHPENAAEAARLKAVWELSDNIEKPIGDSFESRWEKIADKTISKRRSFSLVYKIAASLSGLIIIGSIAFLWVQGGEVVVVAKNASHKTIILPDSSVIVLNSASSIHYNYRLWFLKRSIELEGEAFFDVRKNGMPFTVHTSVADTKVLGTSFNIKQRNKHFSVACTTGKVSVSMPGNKNQIAVTLEKGNKCSLKNDQLIKTNFDVANSSETVWMKRELFFERTPLQEVFDEISWFYDVTITYSGTTEATFSGRFENSSAEDVLKIVCLSSGLRYSKENAAFKISE